MVFSHEGRAIPSGWRQPDISCVQIPGLWCAPSGGGGAAGLAADVSSHLPQFNEMAERLYINWLQTAART